MNPINPRWSDELGCWTGTLETPLLQQVTLYVETAGRDDPPSVLQQRTLDHIYSLEPAASSEIDWKLREFVANNFESDVQAELEDEDFEWQFGAVEIPIIQRLQRTYFMLILHCELGPEHGVGVACRDGIQFAICHPETYHNLNQDDQETLDSPFV